MSDRTKVVIRHLPPTITQDSLLPLIDSSFGRYNWLSFHPPKITKHVLLLIIFFLLLNLIQFSYFLSFSHKHSSSSSSFSRAYINFNTPDDVLDFAHFFMQPVACREVCYYPSLGICFLQKNREQLLC